MNLLFVTRIKNVLAILCVSDYLTNKFPTTDRDVFLKAVRAKCNDESKWLAKQKSADDTKSGDSQESDTSFLIGHDVDIELDRSDRSTSEDER